MILVNKVIKFEIIDNNVSFDDLKKYATKVYHGRPSMLLFKFSNNTVLVFKKLNGRIMGNPHKIYDVLNALPFSISNLTVQTCTFTHNLESEINLNKLNHAFKYEGELFPAAYLRLQNGAHVNLFHTGKVVITGAKTEKDAVDIINYIKQIINKVD